MKCICCEKEILVHPGSEDSIPEQGMWLEGGVSKICIGYGSLHDGTCYIAGFCDECLTDKAKRRIITWDSNYLNEGVEDPYKE